MDSDDSLPEKAPTAEPPTVSMPVGRRNRHRYLRSRAAAAAATESAPPAPPDGPAGDGHDDTVEASTVAATEQAEATIETDSASAAAPNADTADATVAEKPAPKRKQRPWTVRPARKAQPVTDADDEASDTVEAEPEIAEPAADLEDAVDPEESDLEDSDLEESDPAESDQAESDHDLETGRSRRKPVSRLAIGAVAVAAALFVGAGGFAGATVQPYLTERALADTRLGIARTAADAVTMLFTYTPEDMEQLSNRAAKYFTGNLKDQVRKQIDAVAATSKQSQIQRRTQVVGAAVESLDGNNATAIVYANITYTSAATKDAPTLYLVSYRLTMQRVDANWVIKSMPLITQKNLTRVQP